MQKNGVYYACFKSSLDFVLDYRAMVYLSGPQIVLKLLDSVQKTTLRHMLHVLLQPSVQHKVTKEWRLFVVVNHVNCYTRCNQTFKKQTGYYLRIRQTNCQSGALRFYFLLYAVVLFNGKFRFYLL